MKHCTSPTGVCTTSTIGLDLGDRHSHFCVLDVESHVTDVGKLQTTHAALGAFFVRMAPARLVLEVGGHSA